MTGRVLPRRPRSLARLLGLAVVCAIGVGYVQPIGSYLEAKDDVVARRAERASLLRQQGTLRKRLEAAGTEQFILREARSQGLVRPGETLYVVKGVPKWKKLQAQNRKARAE